MILGVKKLNQRIARQLYLNFFIRSLIQPFFISIIYLLCALIVSKYFFKEMPWWYYLILGLPVLILFIFTFYYKSKLFFSDQELWAYIDYKTSSEGLYLTANELNAQVDDRIKQQVLTRNFSSLPLQVPWKVIFNYVIIFILFVTILIFLPKSFLSIENNGGDLLAVENSLLEDMQKAKVLDPKLAEDFKKELESLKEDFKNNGINKENWEKKQNISQMLEDKLKEQEKIQEKIQSQMEVLEKNINEFEKLEEIAKQMAAIESTLALDEFAKQNEDFQKSIEDLKKAISEKKDASSEKKMDLKDKLKALQAMKNFNKEMQKQMEARNGVEPSLEGQKGKSNKGDNKLGKSLSDLAKRLADEEAECEMALASQVPGNGGVSRGRADAELKHTNHTESSLVPLNLEAFNKGGQFNTEGEVVDVTKGEHDKYSIDNQKNTERSFKDTETDLINDQKVLPNRREVIKKYFSRQSNQEK